MKGDQRTKTDHELFDRIAGFALSDTPEIPEKSLKWAATLLVDTLGVAAGATDLESGRIARETAITLYNTSDPLSAAPILFDGRTASMAGAAFAAASQIDNLDGHDGYNPTRGHIGCAIVPALFAFAHHRPELTGREALKAMVIAYEFSARAAIALHATVTDYHTSGAWNALGVAALGCRMRGRDKETLRHALGIAEYHGPRSQMMREIDNPSMLHDGSGMGAMIGTSALLMAEQGFTGAPAITVEAAGVAPHWDDLGSFWTTDLNYIKPYPICRWAHAAIDAVWHLQQETRFDAADIAKVTVNTFEEAARLYAGIPESTSQAQYSLPFAVATMLAHGEIGPSHVQLAAFADQTVGQLLPLIDVKECERHSSRFPLARWSDVTIELKDGRVLSSGDIHARGGPEAPMTDSEIRSKFDAMTSDQLTPDRSEKIWNSAMALVDPDSRLGDLAELVYPAPDVRQ